MPLGLLVGVLGHLIGMRGRGHRHRVGDARHAGLRGGDRRLRLGGAGGQPPADDGRIPPRGRRAPAVRGAPAPWPVRAAAARAARGGWPPPLPSGPPASRSSVACSPHTDECTTSSAPPGRRWQGARRRAGRAGPAVAPGLPRARGSGAGMRPSRRDVRRVGDDQVEALGRRSGASRSPRTARMRTPFRRAFSRALSDRAARDVHGRDRAARRQRGGHGERAAPGAQVRTAPRARSCSRRQPASSRCH